MTKKLVSYDDAVAAGSRLPALVKTEIQGYGGGGSGDASTNTTASVDGEMALFSGTTGKTLKRATASGLVKLTSGVQGTATAGSDYVVPGGALGTPSSGVLTGCTGMPAPQVGSTTSSATPTINFDTTDVHGITAQAVDITDMSANLTYAAPVNGDRRLLHITGTATREITWGSKFEGPLPLRTNGTNRLDVDLVYNAATSKWRGLNVKRGIWNITTAAAPAADLLWIQQLNITALAEPITSLSGGLSNTATLVDGDPFVVTIRDNGTARAIAFGSLWAAQGVVAPTTTVANKWMYLGAKWRSSDSKMVLLAVSQEA